MLVAVAVVCPVPPPLPPPPPLGPGIDPVYVALRDKIAATMLDGIGAIVALMLEQALVSRGPS